MPVVDLHTHFFPENWPDLTQRCGTPDWPWMRRDGPDRATVMVGRREFRSITSACWDPAVRLADMDREGVDVQVVSATPVLFAYDRPAEHAIECARVFNDSLLELCAAGQGRLIPIAQVPLQDTDLACRELERMLAAGMRGVQIGNHVGDRDLDDHGIVEFLAHCASAAPVFVHPWDMFGGCRLDEWMLRWTVAMPSETHLSLNRMILGGVRPAAARSAHLLRPRRRVVHVLAREVGQRLAPPRGGAVTRRPRQLLPRPLRGRFGGVRRACPALPGGRDGFGVGAARHRLPLPLGEEHAGTVIRSCGYTGGRGPAARDERAPVPGARRRWLTWMADLDG